MAQIMELSEQKPVRKSVPGLVQIQQDPQIIKRADTMKVHVQKLAQIWCHEILKKAILLKMNKWLPKRKFVMLSRKTLVMGIKANVQFYPMVKTIQKRPIFHFRRARSSKKNGENLSFWSQNLKFWWERFMMGSTRIDHGRS